MRNEGEANNTETPSVSVIIPTFNRSRSIMDAIDSVMAQTVPVYEVIVVDDGSTDETPEILAGYGDRIIVIRQENRGVSAARNAGIRRATGEWIGFLDSDDLWLEQKIEHFANDLQKFEVEVIMHYSNIDFVGGGYKWNLFDIQRLAVPPGISVLNKDPSDVAVFGCSPISALVRKDVLRRVGLFDEDLSFGEDMLFFFRLSHLGAWIICNRITCVARRLEQDVVSLSQNENRRDGCTVEHYLQVIQRMKSEKCSEAIKKILDAKHSAALFRLAEQKFRDRLGKHDRAILYEAAGTHPYRWRGVMKALLCLALGQRGYALSIGGGSQWHRG